MTIEDAIKAFYDYVCNNRAGAVNDHSLSFELYRDILEYAQAHSERPNDISFPFSLIDTAAIVGYMAGMSDTLFEYQEDIFGTVLFEDKKAMIKEMKEA